MPGVEYHDTDDPPLRKPTEMMSILIADRAVEEHLVVGGSVAKKKHPIICTQSLHFCSGMTKVKDVLTVVAEV